MSGVDIILQIERLPSVDDAGRGDGDSEEQTDGGQRGNHGPVRVRYPIRMQGTFSL